VGTNGLPNTAGGAFVSNFYANDTGHPSFGVNVVNNNSIVQIIAGDSSSALITWVVSSDITYSTYPSPA
jgi:hypothetical protein